MTPAEAADILKRHNEWRRDRSDHSGDVADMVDPKVLGVAIDVAVAVIQNRPFIAVPIMNVVDIARGLTIERDPDRGVYVGVTGDYKDAALLDEAFRKLDGIT